MPDSSIQSLLARLRLQVRRYIVWDSLLAVIAVIAAAFWIAFLVDYLPVRIGGSEMPRSARTVVLIATLIVAGGCVWRFLISRMRRDLPNDSLALLIERHHPEIGGRLVTAVQLGDSPREGDSHSPTFLRQVNEEIGGQIERVDLKRIFRPEPIRQKLTLVVPLVLAMLAMAIASPQTFGRAVSRLTLLSDSPWPRQAQLEMIGVEVPIISALETDEGATELVEFRDSVVRLARGSNATLRIRAAGEEFGHQIPDLCTVSYADDEGNRGQSNLRRVGRVVDGYQSFVLDGPPLTSLSQSVSLTIRGLDDRLANYRIEAVDPPAIADMRMKVRYPDYLRLVSSGSVSEGSEFDQQLNYQAGVRIREGSSLTLVGRASSPLAAVDVAAADSSSGATTGSDDNDSKTTQALVAEIADDAMSFTLRLNDVREATSIRVVPRDADGISAQAAYRYFIGVVRDEVPETSMRLTGIGSSITPIAILPVSIIATDDYGVESMTVSMNAKSPAMENEGKPGIESGNESTDQEHSLTPVLDREGKSEFTIDLRELADQSVVAPVAAGGSVTVGATARDRFNLAAEHITQSELIRLQVVTPETLLATLERRELEFRSRLEQAIDETRRLRQSLTAIQSEAAEVLEKDETLEKDEKVDAPENPTESSDEEDSADRDDFRARQRIQLRIRQAELQAAKSTDELAGIVAGLDDMLLEMVNNRIDSVDRRERLDAGVRTPLASVVEEPFPRLRRQIVELERILMTGEESSDEADDEASNEADTDDTAALQMRSAVEEAVATNEQILLQLSAVLDKMLDLESFNEILDLMRGLIQDQESLLEETEDEQQKRVLDLFQ